MNIAWHQTKNYDALITINANDKGLEFSKDMYGIFLEDINHALDGGLYAEMIQNRDFEYNRTPEDMHWINEFSVTTPSQNWKERYHIPDSLFAWSLKTDGNSVATISQTNQNPLNQNNPMSLEISIQKLNENISVINSGYWGMAVNKGEKYSLSFYSRKDNIYSDGIKVCLESVNGKVYAEKKITGIEKNWKQFQTDFTSSVTDSDARFVIHPLSKGKIWFDVVSLFPKKTFMQRSNGARKELAEMLKNLNPSFLRFPGGCVVEGATLENRIQWKKTIGNISERPGTWNLWGYHTTDGFGFHEYLQLCEDLNVAPMYVINVGMACQARTSECAPVGEIKDYIQNTMDALEYAMGPVSSKWGRLRAKNGHPKPFSIKYLEIGNENRGPYYQEAYKNFYTAIKNKYPDIITIADEPITFNKEDKIKHPNAVVEMVDEHYYKSPLFFFNHENVYNSYIRKDSPKIYIGEFAVTTPDGGMGNLRAALGEAVFMIGMERNADIVRMASYAPTFLNINDQRWVPDMIVYDNNKVYGTPSYYALQLFSQNRPDYVLPCKVVSTNSLNNKNDNLKGGFAFRNRGGQVAYKDIKLIIDGNDVLNDNLKNGTGKWIIKADNWEAKNGILVNKFDEIKSNIWMMNNNWKDYSLQLKVKMIQGEGGIHINFLNGGGGNCSLNLTENNFNITQLTGEGKGQFLKKITNKLIKGKWYDIKIDIKSKNLKCYIDSELFADTELYGSLSDENIYSTAGIGNRNKELIVKIVNSSQKKNTCKLIIQGKDIRPDGDAIIISSTDQDDENTLTNPFYVKPISMKLHNISSSFFYQCPANSISILKLKIK